jgi:hypothetical protein
VNPDPLTPERPVPVALVPQPHGGAIRRGGPGRPRLRGEAFLRACAIRCGHLLYLEMRRAEEALANEDTKADERWAWRAWLVKVMQVTRPLGPRNATFVGRGGQIVKANVVLPARHDLGPVDPDMTVSEGLGESR